MRIILDDVLAIQLILRPLCNQIETNDSLPAPLPPPPEIPSVGSAVYEPAAVIVPPTTVRGTVTTAPPEPPPPVNATDTGPVVYPVPAVVTAMPTIVIAETDAAAPWLVLNVTVVGSTV